MSTVYYTFIENNNKKDESVLALNALASLYKKVTGSLALPEIMKNSSGKPYFVNSPYFFNYSHTNGGILVALSLCEVGCDIQCQRNVTNSLIKKVFSIEEQTEINSRSDKSIIFYLWAYKEAYVKLLGSSIFKEKLEDVVPNAFLTSLKEGVYTKDNHSFYLFSHISNGVTLFEAITTLNVDAEFQEITL